MPRMRDKPMVKKTVVRHPETEEYVRKTWAILIDHGYDANYSTALNYMLLAAILEGIKSGGISQETAETLQSFLNDPDVVQREDLREGLNDVRRLWKMPDSH